MKRLLGNTTLSTESTNKLIYVFNAIPFATLLCYCISPFCFVKNSALVKEYMQYQR